MIKRSTQAGRPERFRDATDEARQRYPCLFSPIQLGPLTLKHRVIMSGHSMKHGEADGTIGPRQHAYITARARGGAAMVSLESVPAHESSHNFPRQIQLFSDRCVPGLTRLADAVHEADSKLSLVLWHGGPNVSHFGRGPALAPSATPAPGTGEVAKAITRAEIADVVRGFGKAAARCREAGLDAVEVQTASNYLLGSFLSPVLNRRTDEYGGSLENRLRIVVEILEAVREATRGELAVAVRTSTIAAGASNDSNENTLAAMSALVSRGLIDWVSVLTGSGYARGSSIPTMQLPRAFLADEAMQFSDELGIPIVLAGRIRNAAEAEQILADGKAKVIAMARSWIAEPDWMNRVAAGEEDRIRPCMSCNQGCLGFNLRNKPGTCVVNPVAGREFEFPPLTPAAVPKRVAVAGGGPGGLETARVAAERGHQVTLYEAAGQLGGTMALAGSAPHRGEIREPIAWWCRELERLGVIVRLNEPLTKAPADADVTVWAVGARPSQMSVRRLRPELADGIPGTRGLPHGRELLAGQRNVQGRVLIIDEEGAWPAISLAEWLAAQADVTAVTVATPAGQWGLPELHLTAEIGSLRQRIAAAGIHVITDCVVTRVADHLAETAAGESLGPFDHVVLSTGATARDIPENDGLAVGDCVAPRGMWAAIHDAARLARRL